MKAESVAVVVAHPDDEVLGCGGTIARLAASGARVNVLILADGESSRERSAGAAAISERAEAARSAAALLGCQGVMVLALPDNRLDGMDLLDVIRPVESFLRSHAPQLVLTHHASDLNIDHRIVSEAVSVACRPYPGQSVTRLLNFEIPSSTEWQPAGAAAPFAPNVFVDIETTLGAKLQALDAYRSELREFPHARSARAIEALARWRGATAGLPAAEAFVLRRQTW